jgi:hypothetical protein
MRTFLLVALLSSATMADETPKPAAERLVRYIIPPERHAEIMFQMSSQILRTFQQMQGREDSAPELGRFRDAMAEAMTYEEMIAIAARIYEAHFTERELAEILAFYQTETGIKFTREVPAMMSESMRATANIVQTRIPALLKKHGLVRKPAPSAAPAEEKATEEPKE